MDNIKSSSFIGRVIMFNGQFGFIHYSEGSIFFHKSSIKKNSLISFNSSVAFISGPSKKKQGKIEAFEVTLLQEKATSISSEMSPQSQTRKMLTETNKISPARFNIGIVKWHDYRGYGVILANEKEYFFRDEDVHGYISKDNTCIFLAKEFTYKYIAGNIFIFSNEYFDDFQHVISDEELFCTVIFEKLSKIEDITGESDFTNVCQLLDILCELKKDTSRIADDLYDRSSIEYRFRFWFKGYTMKFELNNISKFLFVSYNQTINATWKEIIKKEQKKSVIEKLMAQADHLTVFNQFIEDIKSIRGWLSRYDIFSIIPELKSITSEEKEIFYKKLYELCDRDCKFQMWDIGFVTQNDIDIILENIPYLGKFELMFKRLEEDEKFLFLNKSIEVFHEREMRWSEASSVNKLFQLEEVISFVNSDIFKDKLKSSTKGSDIFWFLWYLEFPSINADFITNELSDEEFIGFMKMAQRSDKDYKIKIETFYSELPVYLKLQLWLNNLFGSLDYIEFAKSFHLLTVEDKKFFNKKVKEHAQAEQIKSFIDQIPTAELVQDNPDQKTYRCKWRNIYFNYQQIQIFLNKKESTSDYHCSFSRPEMNLLTQEYFSNRRIEDIYVTVNNDFSIKSIDGLESIETQIIFAEIRKNGSTESRKNVSNEEIIRMIHNVGERNKCIKFLNLQNSPYNVVDIQELVTEVYGGLRRDISFLYCLPDGAGNIYLVWESVEFEKSKATHIFKCRTVDVETYIDLIKRFLESTIHSRSKLNSSEKEDVAQKKELSYFGRIIHDSKDYEVWEERMRNALPFLK